MKPPTFRSRQTFDAPITTGLRCGVDSRPVSFHLRLPFVTAVHKRISSDQQDLSDAALFYRCLSLGRFTEWQFQTNWDHQLAISNRFGHKLPGGGEVLIGFT